MTILRVIVEDDDRGNNDDVVEIANYTMCWGEQQHRHVFEEQMINAVRAGQIITIYQAEPKP